MTVSDYESKSERNWVSNNDKWWLEGPDGICSAKFEDKSVIYN